MARSPLRGTLEETNGKVAGRIILPQDKVRDFCRAGTGGKPGDMFTVAELARALGCSGEGIRHWMRVGWLVPDLVTIGGRAIFRRTSVQKMLWERAR